MKPGETNTATDTSQHRCHHPLTPVSTTWATKHPRRRFGTPTRQPPRADIYCHHAGHLRDTDVLLGCAALAYHTGDHRRASEILATIGSATRSPASFAVYVHHRNLLKAQLSKPELAAILEQAAHLEPTDILDRELKRTPHDPPPPSKADNHATTSTSSQRTWLERAAIGRRSTRMNRTQP